MLSASSDLLIVYCKVPFDSNPGEALLESPLPESYYLVVIDFDYPPSIL